MGSFRQHYLGARRKGGNRERAAVARNLLPQGGAAGLILQAACSGRLGGA